ncbi:hypothetical protein MTO96_014522 [Rhipicephalus appendiculatus]
MDAACVRLTAQLPSPPYPAKQRGGGRVVVDRPTPVTPRRPGGTPRLETPEAGRHRDRERVRTAEHRATSGVSSFGFPTDRVLTALPLRRAVCPSAHQGGNDVPATDDQEEPATRLVNFFFGYSRLHEGSGALKCLWRRKYEYYARPFQVPTSFFS